MRLRLLAVFAAALCFGVVAKADPMFTFTLAPVDYTTAGTGSVDFMATVLNTGTTDITGANAAGTGVNPQFYAYNTSTSFSKVFAAFAGIDLKPGQSVNFAFFTISYANLPAGLYTNALVNAELNLSDATGRTLQSSAVNASVLATAATPEPSSLLLLGTGVLGVFGAARKRLA